MIPSVSVDAGTVLVDASSSISLLVSGGAPSVVMDASAVRVDTGSCQVVVDEGTTLITLSCANVRC